MRSIASALCFLAAVSVQAQSLLTGPNVLTFKATSGGSAPPAQTVAIRHTGDTPRAISAQFSTLTGGNWLTVTPLTGTTPTKLTVTANPAGLPVGTYNATILVSSTGLPSSRIDVSLAVVTTSQLTAAPVSLNFQRQSGVIVAPATDEQLITVNATGSTASFTTTTSTSDNGQWLTATGSTSTPGFVTVRVNSTGLAAGSYTGTVSFSSTGMATIAVPVSLTVTANPILSSSPPALTFTVQRNSTAVSQQLPLITSNNSPLQFTANATTQSGGGWLIVTPLIGTAPGNLDVAVNPAGLNSGTYNGSIVLTSAGAATTNTSIPVTLVVTDFPVLLALPASLSAEVASDVTQAAAVRALSPITVSSTPAGTPFTVSVTTATGGSWLVAGPGSGATISNVVSFVDATGLTAGVYRGQITIAGPANQLVIPVTLTVSGAASIALDPATITFNLQRNQATPSSQVVNIRSTGAAYPFQAAISAITPVGSNWLTLDSPSGTTPAAMTLGINSPIANSLPNGQYTATVTYSAQPGVSPTLTGSPSLNVVLNVSDTPLFNVSPATMDFFMPVGGAPPTARLLAVTATDGSARPFSATFSTTSGGNWLFVSPIAGSTPANITIQPLPSGLSVGTYEGNVAVTVPSISNTPVNVRVRLVVQPNVTISATPTALAFNQASGAPAPAPRTISIAASTGSANYQVTTVTNAGGSWLVATPETGTTPGTINVSVNSTGLSPGTYSGSIGVISGDVSNSPVLIPVTLTVGAPSLTVTPATVTLTATPGSGVAVTQQLAVTAGSAGFTATASTTSGGNWLSVTPTTGGSPGTVTISANPAGLPGGVYTGSITFIAAGVGNSPLTVPVTFNVVVIAPAGRQILSQIADGQGWKTTIILMNLDTEPAPFSLRFYGGDGTALRLPFEGTVGRLEELQGIIPVGGSRTIVTQGVDAALSQGWAELTSTRVVSGLGVFRQRVEGRPDQEAAVPAIVPVSRFVLPYDNTQGFVSSMALANTNASSARAITAAPRADDGSALPGDFVNLPALGQTAFAMGDRFPSMRSRRGSVEFSSNNPDFAALGLRFNTQGAFTSLPTLEVPLTAPAAEVTRVVSQVADGNGWKTTITLVNLDTVPAPFTVRFWRQDGAALAVPQATGGSLDTIEGTIPVGGTRIIETLGGNTPLVQGWAQLTTTRNINGLGVFRQRVEGRPDQEAAVTLTLPSTRFSMPYDNTTDLVTTMALVNTSVALGTSVSVIIRDEAGNQVGTDVIVLTGRAQTAFALTDRFQTTRGRRGTIEFSSTSQITGLGFRFNPTGAFTSFPVSRR